MHVGGACAQALPSRVGQEAAQSGLALRSVGGRLRGTGGEECKVDRFVGSTMHLLVFCDTLAREWYFDSLATAADHVRLNAKLGSCQVERVALTQILRG